MAGELGNTLLADVNRTNYPINYSGAGIEFNQMMHNEIAQTLLIIILFVFVGIIVARFTKQLIRIIIEKNPDNLEDIISEKIAIPILFSVITVGVYIALRNLSSLAPHSVWVTRIFFAILVLLGAHIVSAIAGSAISYWFKVKKNHHKAPELINRIITITIFLICGVTILAFFGIQVGPIIATLGIGGLAIGLALQPTLTSFFAGLQLISDKPADVGDFVEIENGNIKGYIQDIGWRSTRIKTLGGVMIVVPNTTLANSIIMNDSTKTGEKEQNFNVSVACGVGYDSDLKKVEKITLDVARKIQNTVDGAVKNHEPAIRYNEFADSNINFNVILKSKSYSDQFLIKHEFIKALKERYDKERIDISYPVRKIVNAVKAKKR